MPHPTSPVLRCGAQDERQSWHVKDLGSTNGVLVNGVRVKAAYLAQNDVVSFGGANLVDFGNAVVGEVASDFRYRFSTDEESSDLDKPVLSATDGCTTPHKIQRADSSVSMPRRPALTVPSRPPKSKGVTSLYDSSEARARISAYNKLQVSMIIPSG